MRRFGGREIDTAGDGFFVTFGSPGAAIRFARGAVAAVGALGVEARAGLHIGECEVHGGHVSGIGVHIGARIVALAAAGEVLVSRTLRDLVAGSDVRLLDRGLHGLKGVPGRWHLYSVA
jgi:class 3 adenylate cyclase